MEMAKLVLDYIKALMWPMILAIVLFMYSDEVLEIISTREVDAFGLKLGGTLDNLAETYEAEIAVLKSQIAEFESNNEGQKGELISKLNSISSNVRQDLTALRSKVESPSNDVTTNKEEAMAAEQQGFEALKNKNIDLAIAQFAIAKEKWPNYHNVDELHTLLNRMRGQLRSPAQWQKLYQTILTNYSWGMTKSVRAELQQAGEQ